jgi:pimeloyl-ACP methyl ester carboxylesterase
VNGDPGWAFGQSSSGFSIRPVWQPRELILDVSRPRHNAMSDLRTKDGRRQFALLAAVAFVLASNAQAAGRRIEEASFVTVGGIEQWVTIRGDDDARPLLLLLHGGPGDVQSPFVSTYAPYERDFVLVQWDERGAGRTFAKNGAAGVTLEKQITDGIDLSEQLRRRFPRQKLILFGHSWGSIVATGMAQRRPDLFAAYVGTGQVASWADTVQFQFQFLRQRYKEQGATTALAALDAIGTPDPTNLVQYFGFSRPIRQNMNPSDTAWLTGLLDLAKASGETDATIKVTSDGMSASGAALAESVVAENLPATASTFRIPYYVIQGRHDLFAPTALAEAYFAGVSAPAKRMIIIEDAGHFALSTHQAAVIAALEQLVR